MPRWIIHALIGIVVYVGIIGGLLLLCWRAPMDPENDNTEDDEK